MTRAEWLDVIESLETPDHVPTLQELQDRTGVPISLIALIVRRFDEEGDVLVSQQGSYRVDRWTVTSLRTAPQP